MPNRIASQRRETKETTVLVELDLDGKGEAIVETGIGMFDHLLTLLARHGGFDLKVEARGDVHIDPHHTVEDVAIVLGRALHEALGERRGITRMSHAIVPFDEALALVAVDLSGRGYAVIDAPFSSDRVGELPTDLVPHFLQSLAIEGRLNLHVRLMAGANDHHRAEVIIKALARALGQAVRIDPRLEGRVPSTKETLDA
ncbi:MAG: imidazoleglycerol-phosphate dehydratase HisB [Dehalococcoidia bacterium]|nr:imidazoleglycerol-phosphate dehydratase HisB [Dehalococcoidia bacterium]